MDIFGLFAFLGGLGMFLYGMYIMSEGLELAAGDRLRSLLEKMTKNRFLGVLVGAGVTAIIQSSSATTVMVVGFVNAKLMDLSQAIGVIMGANIGTTITAQILAFNISSYAPLILFIGAAMFMFMKKKLMKNIGVIILGAGGLFVGMSIMSDSLAPLKNNEAFVSILSAFENPVLSVLSGAFFTAIIQSSSAAVGIVQAFASQGVLSFDVAVFIVMGMNIGTCITAVLASLSAGRASKRAALMHVLFNVIGTILFGTALLIFPSIIRGIESLSPGEPSRQIANLHLIFNICTTVVLFPFASLIVKLVKLIIPLKGEGKLAEKRLVYLDKNIVLTPSIAVTQAHREVCRMGHITCENYEKAINAFFTMNDDLAKEILEVEDTINYLNHQIAGCIVHLRALGLNDADLQKLGMMFHVINDIERIGDHAENIAEYELIASSEKMRISEVGLAELKIMANRSLDMFKEGLSIYENENFSRLPIASEIEEEVDVLQETLINNHINRLMEERCDPRGGVMFIDMVTDLERCADHAINIAYSIKGEQSSIDNQFLTKQRKRNEQKEKEKRMYIVKSE
ncbi:MAG: Na/Pi cotransporter family protein [Clostridiales bacterium]|nr:Na/Pi cotransporter family protein [Clostridiales bacterium]